MRITRDTLLKYARNTVTQRVDTDRSLVCVYLTGSLLQENPLLGGTTDIDLIFVHDSEPPVKREISRVGDEIHLDITHLSQLAFDNTRQVRVDPWLGSFLCYNPLPLYDTRHWFEFTQASVCAQFNQPENILKRALPQAETARQFWLDLHARADDIHEPDKVLIYLKALEKAANSIACLSSAPLTERRFMLFFPSRADAIGRPGLAGGLVDLIMSQPIPKEDWQEFLDNWLKCLTNIGELKDCPAHLSSHRRSYFEGAVRDLIPEHPEAALWVLLRTWTLALCCLPKDTQNRQSWHNLLERVELDEDHFAERINSLDTYLDIVEETLELWANQKGI